MSCSDSHIISADSSVLDGLRRLNGLSGGVMTLIVTDADGRLAGTVTDGDIRRGFLGCATTSTLLREVMHTSCRSLSGEMSPLERVAALRDARVRGIKLLPVTDADGRVIDVVDLVRERTRLPLTAILMAGGKGERLRPLTLKVPKPLLEIDGRPIIDYNVENLAKAGIRDVWVTVRYLADMIREYFAVPRHGIMARCVEETMPLGTIGSAALVELPEEGDTLVMNSDLLTTVDLEEMYLRHVAEGAEVTVAAIPYTVSVPYAILTTDGTRVTALSEKTTYSHLANAGIYIFSNRILRTLDPSARTDATDLIERAMETGRKVTYYPIKGVWIDIGSPADFKHAGELMRHHRSMAE